MRFICACLSAAIITHALMAAAIAADNKKVIYFIGCKNTEAVADIKYSIDGIANYAEQHEISIGKGTKGEQCGYLLIFNDKKKTLNSALTDVDLHQIMKKFYNLKE